MGRRGGCVGYKGVEGRTSLEDMERKMWELSVVVEFVGEWEVYRCELVREVVVSCLSAG